MNAIHTYADPFELVNDVADDLQRVNPLFDRLTALNIARPFAFAVWNRYHLDRNTRADGEDSLSF